jgi:hypothetical protein
MVLTNLYEEGLVMMDQMEANKQEQVTNPYNESGSGNVETRISNI